MGTKRRTRGSSRTFLSVTPASEVLERRRLLASTILFNPTGTNATLAQPISALDFSPGNVLAENSVPLTVGMTFQLDYQAALAGVIDPNGKTVSPPGLNFTYQITGVSSFTEVVTSLSPDHTVATFSLAPVQSPNSFFELYFNRAVVANNLAGTGFNVGTLILSGKPSPSPTNSGNFKLAVPPQILPFDLFNPVNYPAILSVTGVGSAVIDADVTSFDPAFFVTPVSQLSFNTSTITPFFTTDPSMQFVGTPGGVQTFVTPIIGAVNGGSGPDFQFQADANTSFVVAAPAINIVKQTNGQVALTPTGPVVTVGSAVNWTYDVTNPGNEPLRNVVVTDDNGTPNDPADDFHPTFTGGDTNGNGLLDPGEDWKYAAQGTARAGQYENHVVTTAAGNLGNTPVTATSLSHYFVAAPAINIVKQTNGQVALTPTGPVVTVGSAVNWTYDVTNPGNEPLRNVVVTDDNGTPNDPADDFHPTFVGGDTNNNGLLDPGEDWKYTAQATAKSGQYENHVVTTAAGNVSNTPVNASSLSHYFAAAPAIKIVKQTNGQVALTPTGPVVMVGSTVTFTYVVTNPDTFPLHNVTLVDDNGTPNNPTDDFHPTFVGGDTNNNGLLDPGETWTYTASQIATSGQYTNIATVTGLSPTNVPVTAQAPGNHFGMCPMVVNVQRFGVHHQPTQIVVTFDGPLTPAQAENISNYHLFALGPDGKFSREVRIVSAVYDPATNSVTLTAAHQLNVHHLSKITVTNPCPGGPAFTGILNRKFSLGAIVGHHGHVFVPPPTHVPGVLNPAVLPKVLAPSNRPAELKLSKRPGSGAFFQGNVSGMSARSSHESVRPSARAEKPPLPQRIIHHAVRLASHLGNLTAASLIAPVVKV